MAKPKFTAKFSDGTVLTRSSDRQYTHAWLAHGTMSGTPVQEYQAKMGMTVSTTWKVSGFASSEALANRTLAQELRWRSAGAGAGQYVVEFSGIAPVEGGAL